MRPKLCKSCKVKFQPERTFQPCCSVPCAISYIEDQKEKKRKKEYRERKEAQKTKRQLTKEAQREFNRFIRQRDRLLPCISSGVFGAELPDRPGGKWDAGHYLTIGAHPELRFDETNCHKQSKKDNGGSGQWTRKDKTVHERYRVALIEKIGLAAVEWLEGPHEPKKYTREELIQIKKDYQRKVREL